MKKISNHEEANQYYEIINSNIDKYISEHRIKPSNLNKYFKNSSKVESFLKRLQIDDVEGIKTVLKDVLEDRNAGEKDGLITFERFLLKESFGKIDVKDSDVSYEKILADLYNTSVGHIEIADIKFHKYKINDFGVEKNVSIYSKVDLTSIKKSLIPMTVSSFKGKEIKISGINIGLEHDGQIPCDLSISLDDVVSEELVTKLVTSKIGKKFIIKMISFLLNTIDHMKSGNKYIFIKEYKDYFIWESKSIKL